MSTDQFSEEEIAILKGMIDEYKYAEHRRLLWSQRFHGVSGTFLQVAKTTFYVLQTVIAIAAIYALTHH